MRHASSVGSRQRFSRVMPRIRLMMILVVAAAAVAHAQVRLGGEVLVDRLDGGAAHGGFAAAMAGNQEAVVVWARLEQGRVASLHAQHFEANGVARGEVLEVLDSSTASALLGPDIAFLRSGSTSFVVVWAEEHAASAGQVDTLRIRARRFSSNGLQTGELEVEVPCASPAAELCGFLEAPRAAGLPRALGVPSGDRVVVAWARRDLGAAGPVTRVERVLLDFEALTASPVETLVEDLAAKLLHLAAVESEGVDEYLVAWSSLGDGLRARRFFSSDGTPSSPIRRLAEAADPLATDAALTDRGDVVAAWRNPATGSPILAQRFNERLRAVAPSARTPEPFDGAAGASGPSVDVDPAGNFFVAWSRTNEFGGSEIEARRFNWVWGAIGEPFQVNTTPASDLRDPTVAVGLDGTVQVVWRAVDGDADSIFLQRFAATACLHAERTLCLQDGRYRVEVEWKDFSGRFGHADAALPLTRDTGDLWFFNPSNVELVVKVLDGRAINGRYWVFYGALSNVEYEVQITDTMTGEEWISHNPPHRFASVADLRAFAGDDLVRLPGTSAAEPAEPDPLDEKFSGSCAPSPERLCLGDRRFEVTADWRDFGGEVGVGKIGHLTQDTGYFWFFNKTNVEVVVKVLDGREHNGFFWVFYGALSNVEYTIRVRDTVTGEEWESFNPLGTSGSIGDVRALPGG